MEILKKIVFLCSFLDLIIEMSAITKCITKKAVESGKIYLQRQ